MANEQNLKPFPKGVSGNPAGKPKGTEHSKTRLKRLLDLVQKKRNPITGEEEEFTVLDRGIHHGSRKLICPTIRFFLRDGQPNYLL